MSDHRPVPRIFVFATFFRGVCVLNHNVGYLKRDSGADGFRMT
jgi:hypothetical protein